MYSLNISIATMAAALAVAIPLADALAAPNIVVIMTDDQRADETRAIPHTLSLIAAQGIVYSNAIAHAPLCAPSRATFLTGQYAHNHGVLANQDPFGYAALDNDQTLPVWLQDEGYHTIFIDKYVNGYGEDGVLDAPPGWSDWRAALTLQYYNYAVVDNGTIIEYGGDPWDYRTDVMTSHAVDAIANAPLGRPYFVYVATMAPHEDLCDTCNDLPTPAPRHIGAFAEWTPPRRPPSFNEADMSDKPAHMQGLPPIDSDARARLLTKERRRMESLLSVDEMVKQIFNAVQMRGDLDNTFFIFTSDNGYIMGEHRLAKSHKKAPYEESIGVPLYIRPPGGRAMMASTKLVSNQDLAPTIVALAGARATRDMDGESLLKIDPMRAVYLYNYRQKGPPAYEGVRTRDWVYLRHETGEEELYDLDRDPYQIESRHDRPAYAGVKADLIGLVDDLRLCAGATCNCTYDLAETAERSGAK